MSLFSFTIPGPVAAATSTTVVEPDRVLPSIQIDNVSMLEDNAVVLMNQNPAAGEDRVAVASHIEFDLAVPSGSTLDTAQVYVDAVSAWTLAGGFTTGYDGAGSTTASPDADTLRVTVDLTTDMLSEALVTVRVVGTGAGLTALDTTYTFTVADVTPPQVLDAVGQDLRTVRVTFNEAMTATAATNTESALSAANYSLVPAVLPAVTLQITSVAQVSSTEYDITTDIDITMGGSYLLTVSNAEDLQGNAVIAPNNTVNFLAYQPAVPAGRDFDLWSMVPAINRLEDITGDLHAFISCLQEVTNLIIYDIDRFPEIFDYDIADEVWVDAMLVDVGNPFAFQGLSLNDKRRLLDILVPLYRQKGTCIGVENAIRFFTGVDVTCTAYNEACPPLGVGILDLDFCLGASDSASLYTFDLIAATAFTDAQRKQVVQLVDLMKVAHSHLGNIIEP